MNSIEYNGRYYAALDFTPPNSGGDPAGQKTRILMPYGWEVADITDDVRDAVVRLHTFGTDYVVGEGGKAFHTSRGTRPGALEMIWDYKWLGLGIAASVLEIDRKVGQGKTWACTTCTRTGFVCLPAMLLGEFAGSMRRL